MPVSVRPYRRLYLGGEWVEGSGGERAPITDPSTGAVVAEVAVATLDDARAAVDAAQAHEDAWAATPGAERARILRKAAERLAADAEGLARTVAQEVGKPIRDSRGEVRRAVSVLRYAADEIRHLTGATYPADAYELPPGNEGRTIFTVRDPVGVVVAIGPFNFPLNLLCHKIAPALAAGNPVVAKPPTAGPSAALALARHLEAAGLPRGVLQVIVGPGATVGEALVRHPKTRLVSFTGSTAVGTRLASFAAGSARRVILELGGMDPTIVCDDAPIGPAAEAVARGAFGYAGQVCTASKRIFVAGPIAKRFRDALAERARSLRVGPALDEATEVGPVIDRAAVERLESMVADALARSARAVVGGAALPGPGTFFAPTVLEEVPPEARVLNEEPFGPLAPLARFDSDEEAVALANRTRYGLQAAVWTRDLGRALRLVRAIRAGGVHVNDPTTLRWDALPFGGTRESGLGREGVAEAMREMTEVKLVSLRPPPD